MEEEVKQTVEETPAAEVEQTPETVAEVPAEETPQPAEETKEEAKEEAVAKTANDRLKERYPDENPQTDEEWEKLRQRFMDDSEAAEKDRAEWEQEVNDLILSDTDMAAIANEMMVNHLPFRAAVAKVIDLEDLKPQEGEDDYEAWDKAYKERLSHNKAMVERQKEIDSNEEKSFENIDKFCADRGYDDKAKDGIVDFINEVFDAIVMKNISPELLEKLDKARTYDSAVRDAELKGEVKGRNANIEAQRVDEMEKEEGDGIPAPRATGGSPLQPREEPRKDLMDGFMRGIGENKWMNNR